MMLIETFCYPIIKQVSEALPEAGFLVTQIDNNLAQFKQELDDLV